MPLPRNRLLRLLSDARAAFRAAPLEATLALLAAATFSFVLARDGETATAGRFLVTIGLALPAVFAVTLLHAQGTLHAGARWALSFAVLALAASYAFGSFEPEYSTDGWRLGLLLAAAALLPFVAPTLGAGRRRSWWIHARLLLRVAVAGAYGAALFVGIALAIAAIGQLFELKIHGEAYAHLAGWTFLALVPWLVVGRAEALVRPDAPRADDARRFARVVAIFLAAPLAIGYTAILYAYAVRVAVTGEVPKNLLSPLVACAAALWLLAAFLVEPLRGRADAAGLTRLVRWLPAALLPMLGLGLWAVGVRIAQYGWTEFRYVRVATFVALAGLAAAGTVRLWTGRGGRSGAGVGSPRPSIRREDEARATAFGGSRSDRAPLPWATVPAVLAAAAFLSAVGPWSAPAVTRRSQQARLADAIERAREVAGVPADTTPGAPTPRPIPPELYETINQTAVFLGTHFGPDALKAVVRLTPADDYGAWTALADSLGFSRGPVAAPAGLALLVEAWRPDTVAVHGIVGGSLYPVEVWVEGSPGWPRPAPIRPGCPAAVDWIDPVDDPSLEPATHERAGVRLTLEPRAARVVVERSAGTSLTADLSPLVDRVAARAVADCSEVPALSAAEALVPLRDDSGRTHGQLLVDRVQILVPPDTASGHTAPHRPILRLVRGQLILPSRP